MTSVEEVSLLFEIILALAVKYALTSPIAVSRWHTPPAPFNVRFPTSDVQSDLVTPFSIAPGREPTVNPYNPER